MDDDDARAVHDADANRRAGPGGKVIRVADRARAQLVEVEVGVAELEQAGPELVLLRIRVLFDEAVRLKGLQEPVDGRPRQTKAVGQLADAQAPRTAREGSQDGGRPVDRLDRRAARLAGLVIRHC